MSVALFQVVIVFLRLINNKVFSETMNYILKIRGNYLIGY